MPAYFLVTMSMQQHSWVSFRVEEAEIGIQGNQAKHSIPEEGTPLYNKIAEN
jgi:hypothetical protein